MQMGLQEEPPKLSGPEKKELEKRYIEQYLAKNKRTKAYTTEIFLSPEFQIMRGFIKSGSND